MIVEIRVKDPDLHAQILNGNWGNMQSEMARERLTLLGPISTDTFDSTGCRLTEVALPHFGRWARWNLRECDARQCGEGGVTWAMAVVLANLVGSLPEYPRLRILELGAGTGLVALTLAGRGHEVIATDGDECVVRNLRQNVEGTTALPGKIKIQQLRWHVEEERVSVAAKGPFDMIVGADIIYDAPTCDALRSALRRLLARDAEAILAERNRVTQGSECISVMRRDGWQIEELGSSLSGSDAVINGEENPRLLQAGSSSPLILRIRLPLNKDRDSAAFGGVQAAPEKNRA